METQHINNNNNYNKDKQIRILRLVMRFAGVFILLSVILSVVHSVYWLLFTGFVGLNLLQYSFTKFCPLEIILRKIIK